MRRYLASLLFLSNLSYAEPIKIGYINIDHVVSSSPQFNKANKLVAEKFKPKERQLILLSEQIKSSINQLNTNKTNLTQLEIKSKVSAISDLEKELKQQALILKKQLESENKQKLGEIQDLINQVIRRVALEQNFDLILYQKVAYASNKINITPLISQKLKERFY